MKPRRRPLFCARGHRLLTEVSPEVFERTENCGVNQNTGYHYCKKCNAAATESWRRAHGVKARKIDPKRLTNAESTKRESST